jgi:hypothetical protein
MPVRPIIDAERPSRRRERPHMRTPDAGSARRDFPIQGASTRERADRPPRANHRDPEM